MEPNLTSLDPLTSYEHQYQCIPPRPPPYTDNPPVVQPTVEPTPDQVRPEQPEDSKEALKCLLNKNSRRKCTRIHDKTFPFYGCTICDVSFVGLRELDQHMTVHKGRLTSYELRVLRQQKKKLQKKQQKLLKKIKKENKKTSFDIEIKPEDGFIGTETAIEYQNAESNQQNNENVPLDTKINSQSESKTEQDGGSTQNGGAVKDPRLESLYKCFACQKQFSLSYYLKLHVRSHTDEKPYQCAECGQSFITASHLGRHTKRIHLAIRYQCRICYRFFTRFEYLTRHFDKKHLDEKLEGEPYDYNAILPYLKELEEQLGKDEIDKKVKTEGVDKHPNEKVEIEFPPSEVEIAPDGVKMTPDVKDEVKPPGLKNEDKKMDVENNGDLYPVVDVLLNEDGFQDDDEPYVEFEIKKEKEEELEVPVETIDNRGGDSGKDEGFSDEDYFPINTWASTPKVIMEPSSPIKIREKINKSEFPRKCEFCEKIINSHSYMRVHLRTHTGEKPFKCQYCNSAFITSSKLHRHELTHAESKDTNKVKDEQTDIKAKDNDEDFGTRSGCSDDDYFPSNTWASTPKVIMEPSSPIKLRKKFKKSDFPRKCDYCEKIINSHSYMRVHLRTHTGEKPFKCQYCNRAFITSSKLHRHEMIHIESWDDTNKFKNENTAIKTEDNDEDITTSDGKKPKGKPKERKGFVRKKEYQKRTYPCPRCHKRFLHKDSMLLHEKNHKDEPLALKCIYCLIEQPDEETLKQHESSHTGQKRYECSVCLKKYTRKENLMFHRKIHDSSKPPRVVAKYEFVCDICSKTFNASSKLQRHLVTHQTNQYTLRYECPVCAHMFHTKYHVQMHLVTHQKEGLILEENRNEIIAMVLQNARRIPKAPEVTIPTPQFPADERSRICNICGEIFQHFYYLEEHLKSHGTKIAIEDLEKGEEKRHKCHVCQKGFKLPYYLKLHSFTHTKEKPFICQQCGKGFITRGKLKRHMETHSGLKKYQCHICYKFFTRPSYLRIHVRTIHGTQDYNFRVDKSYAQYSME